MTTTLKEIDEEFGYRVSKALEQALGETVMNVVYTVLRRDFGIGNDEIAANPNALKEVLRRFFGPSGLDFLEELISREIIAEFELPAKLEEASKTLAEVLRIARLKVSPE